MRRFGTYALLQGKRALRLLPQLLAVTLLLTLAAALCAAVLSARRDADASRQKVLVGVVAEEWLPYLKMGIRAMESFDASREEIHFIPMEEPEALEQLRAGVISAYLVVPADFLETIYGEVDPIRFVSLDGAAGLETLLAAELADAVARLMTETLNAQYGAIRYAAEHLPAMNAYEANDELVDRYFAITLDRSDLFRVETVGLSGTLGFGGYYFCGLSVALLLLFGIGASPLFSRRSDELGLMLRARGFGAARQIAGEFTAFFLLMLLGALCAGAAGLLLLRRFAVDVPELRFVSAARLFGALAYLVLMLGAMQFFLYEFAPENPGGILLQFLNAAAQGYAAGCFYPYSFFPDVLRRFGALLPAGVALRYFDGVVSGEGGYGLAMAGYAVAFLLLAAALRRRRLAG